MHKYLVLGAAVAALTLSAANSQAAQLVTNGDFSTGDLSGWTLFNTTNGTTGYAPGAQVKSFNVTGQGATSAAEFQVGQQAYTTAGAGGGIFQTINATAGLLTFSADFSAYLNEGLNVSGGVFSVLLDDVVLDSFDVGSIAGDMTTPGFRNRPPVFTPAVIERGVLSFSTGVTAGSHVLKLQVTRALLAGDGSSPVPRQYFDNVSAIQADVAAVPEPATWALMILGFGFAGASLRRRARLAI